MIGQQLIQAWRHSKAALGMASVLLACSLGSAAAETVKHAFVVGIDRYYRLEDQLKHAGNDALSVRAVLEHTLRFKTVDFHVDLGREPFYAKWQSFLDRIDPGDFVAVFLAGHGIEINGASYLLPAGVPPPGDGVIVPAERTIALAGLLDDIDMRGPSAALVILDACRDNHYAAASGATISSRRGLSRHDPPRKNMLIIYSTGFGEVALDDVPGQPQIRNSLFTHTLVQHLKVQGLELSETARRVQREVSLVSRTNFNGWEQSPTIYSQLPRDIYLNGRPQVSPAAMAAATALPANTAASVAPPQPNAAQRQGTEQPSELIVGRFRDAYGRIEIEIARDGDRYVIRNRSAASLDWTVGEILGEVRYIGEDKENHYIGRHAIGGEKRPPKEWGQDGKLVMRRNAMDELFVRFLDTQQINTWALKKVQ